MDPEEYVFDWMKNKDEVLAAHRALKAALANPLPAEVGADLESRCFGSVGHGRIEHAVQIRIDLVMRPGVDLGLTALLLEINPWIACSMLAVTTIWMVVSATQIPRVA
jgi:hypothetical protein